ncbi:MAG: alpha/beta hydrolase [Lachnospiraceae bacterium]|nr:alpha/beta hydrolase [Lachnospiraceae bacterium]
MKLAVVFPGIGYHTDKPLLYYSRKMARQLGFEVIEVPYGGFSAKKDLRENADRMEAAFQHAFDQTEEILKGVSWEAYESLIFISKSIGTAAAARYADVHGLDAHHIYYTPVEGTFSYMKEKSGIAFTGTKDQWVDYRLVVDKCREKHVPCYVTENANHSIETGDILVDLKNLDKIMGETWDYMQNVRWHGDVAPALTSR